MRTARSDIEYFIAAHPHHAAAGNPDHPNIERIHVGVVTAHPGMFDRGCRCGSRRCSCWFRPPRNRCHRIHVRYIKAPATLAAGPDSIVTTGRRRISCTFITPPSPRMIISGAAIPAFAHGCFGHVRGADHFRQDAGV